MKTNKSNSQKKIGAFVLPFLVIIVICYLSYTILISVTVSTQIIPSLVNLINELSLNSYLAMTTYPFYIGIVVFASQIVFRRFVLRK